MTQTRYSLHGASEHGCTVIVPITRNRAHSLARRYANGTRRPFTFNPTRIVDLSCACTRELSGDSVWAVELWINRR